MGERKVKKLSDFKKGEKERVQQEITEGTHKIAMSDDTWESPSEKNAVADFGLCTNCKWLRASKTKYGRIYAFCMEWDRALSGVDLIERCNRFDKRGQMSLYDMQQIAVIIEVDKRKVGF